MTEHKTETHKTADKANGGTDAAAAKDAAAPNADGFTFDTYEPKGEKIEAHLADKVGTVDTVAGPAGYKPGDLIVKDVEKTVPNKQLYYIIPAEAAEGSWQKSTATPAAKPADSSSAHSHAQEAAPANHTTTKK